ncbi:MAG: peptidoglycan-binding protein [Candidatus Sericytochromatia bacterium]
MIQFSSGANQLFSKLDTDRNGVSFGELQKLLKKADGAGEKGKTDGKLSAEEVKAALHIDVSQEDLEIINATLTEMKSLKKSADFDPSMVVFQRMSSPSAQPESPAVGSPDTLPEDVTSDYLDSGLLTTANTGSVSQAQVQEMIRDIQKRLRAVGYERAQETGTMDNTTRSLIQDLQRDRDLPQTGRWNAKVAGVASEIANLPPARNLASAAEEVASNMRSKGRCYRGVKEAIKRSTGVYLEGGSAWQAAGQLARSPKFKEVQLGSQADLTKLPPGAVVVWPQSSRSPHGHISVSLGNGREASDHVQNQITSLRSETRLPRVFLPNS